MVRTLAPVAALILLAGCFKAGDDDDEIGGATEESGTDSTDDSASTDTDSSTTETTTETDDTTEDTGPMCEPPETACGQVCADLDSDPEHCGACDHSCLGGECTAGVCAPVELASGKGRLFMVQVDADYIYYGGDGVDVGRMKKDGTNDTVLQIAGPTNADKEWCYQSAITTNAVVWGNDWVQPGVRGCATPDCAGGVQTFVPGLNMYAMAYGKANDTLYWNQGPDIHQRMWPGGMDGVLATTPGTPHSIAADPNYVYWAVTIAANDNRLQRVAVGGGAIEELAGPIPSIGDIQVGMNALYWAEDAQINFKPLAGGPIAPFATSDQPVRFMAVDATHLYWTAGGDLGSVQRCPSDGCVGGPEVLSPSVSPWGITLDPAAVYWVTESGGVHKLAK